MKNMNGFVPQALRSKVFRVLFCLLVGTVLLLVAQQEMVQAPTLRFAKFSLDKPVNKHGFVKLKSLGIIDQPEVTTDAAPTQETQQHISLTTRAVLGTSQRTVTGEWNSETTHGNTRDMGPPLPHIERKSFQENVKGKLENTKMKFCKDKSSFGETLSGRLGRITSNMESWKFGQAIECPVFNISEVKYDKPRLKLSLNCNQSEVSFDSVAWTYNTSDVVVADFGDTCVDNYIQNCCNGSQKIPNVVHYVWYMRGELTFVGFTSLLGAIRFIKPCAIIFHGDTIPHGKYWDFIVKISPNIILLKRDRPEHFSGQKIKHREHSSDIMRLEALIQYGGIYMDTDTIIVKSLEPLRNYSCVMSKQSSGLLGSAFVMAEKNASFLQLWMDGYRYHYESSKYTYNAMVYPNKVVQKHPDLIHIEYTTISRPRDMIGGKIYYNEYATYDWSYIYGIHLYSRIYKKPFNEHTIRNMNTTVGSISRHVVFGNKELCV